MKASLLMVRGGGGGDYCDPVWRFAHMYAYGCVAGELQTAVRLPVFVTCFANAPGESRDMVLGSESGAIYRTQRQSDILQEVIKIDLKPIRSHC